MAPTAATRLLARRERVRICTSSDRSKVCQSAPTTYAKRNRLLQSGWFPFGTAGNRKFYTQRFMDLVHCHRPQDPHPFLMHQQHQEQDRVGMPSVMRLFASVWDKMVSRPILLQPVKAATPATVCRTNSAIELLLLHRRLFPVLFLGTKRSSAIAVGALMSRPPEPTARSGCAVQSDLAPSEGAIKLRSVLDRSRLRVAPDCCAMD